MSNQRSFMFLKQLTVFGVCAENNGGNMALSYVFYKIPHSPSDPSRR